MKKEIVLVKHPIEDMEKKEKILVGILLIPLPLIAFVQTYQYYETNLLHWLSIASLSFLLLLSVYVWNRLFLGLSIFLQYIAGGSLIAERTLVSMSKGIELIAGPNPQFQYGLINFFDLFLIVLVLGYVTVLTSHLSMRRRTLKEASMQLQNLKEI